MASEFFERVRERPTVPRSIVYARVSTVDRGQNPQVQLVECREHAQRCGWEVVEEIVDFESGAKAKRPGLERLRELVWKRKVDIVLVVRLDRLGRSLRDLMNLLYELREHGVGLVSLKEQLDFSSPSGRFMFHLIGALAEFERELIRDRVKSGLAYARACGIRIGRPQKLNHELIQRIVQLNAKGSSIRDIAKAVGVSKTAVHKALKILSLKTPEKSQPLTTEPAVHLPSV